MATHQRRSSHERQHLAKHEEDFKISARRNRLLGLWAAERMGLTGPEAEAYARDLVVHDLDEPGEDDVRRKVLDDLADKGIIVTETEVAQHMASLFDEARAQIAKENP